MPAAALPGFGHIANTHCSSSSLLDVLRYDGQVFSEALIFGLGAGLGFFYHRDDAASPSRRFNGRANDLEGKFYRLVESPLVWRNAWDVEWMAATLTQGRPLLAQSDIAYLPHYQDKNGQGVHFPLHGIVIAGLDKAAGLAWIADTFSSGLLSIPLDKLRAALDGKDCPMMIPYRVAAAPRVCLAPSANLFARAIHTAIGEMLAPNRAELGIPAMRQLAQDFAHWFHSRNWEWCARFAYQSIEKRGTGGGGFRIMYASFLDEAMHFIPELRQLQAAPRMRQSADRWSELANLCKQAFISRDGHTLGRAGQITDGIADHEEALLCDMAQAIRRYL